MFADRRSLISLETQILKFIQFLVLAPNDVSVFDDLTLQKLHPLLVVDQFQIQIELLVFARTKLSLQLRNILIEFMDLIFLGHQNIGDPIDLVSVVLTVHLLSLFGLLLELLYFLLVLLVDRQQLVLFGPQLIDVVFEFVDDLLFPFLGDLDGFADLHEPPVGQLLELPDFIVVAADDLGLGLVGTAVDVGDLLADPAIVEV